MPSRSTCAPAEAASEAGLVCRSSAIWARTRSGRLTSAILDGSVLAEGDTGAPRSGSGGFGQVAWRSRRRVGAAGDRLRPCSGSRRTRCRSAPRPGRNRRRGAPRRRGWCVRRRRARSVRRACARRLGHAQRSLAAEALAVQAALAGDHQIRARRARASSSTRSITTSMPGRRVGAEEAGRRSRRRRPHRPPVGSAASRALGPRRRRPGPRPGCSGCRPARRRRRARRPSAVRRSRPPRRSPSSGLVTSAASTKLGVGEPGIQPATVDGHQPGQARPRRRAPGVPRRPAAVRRVPRARRRRRRCWRCRRRRGRSGGSRRPARPGSARRCRGWWRRGRPGRRRRRRRPGSTPSPEAAAISITAVAVSSSIAIVGPDRSAERVR